MIKELRLINFRNFNELKLESLDKHNFIVWENWKGKTNILEALSALWNNSITWLNLDELIKKWEDYFFVEYITDKEEKVSFSYSKETWKKSFMLNNNKISIKKFKEATHKCVIFSPIIMNIMYLSPSLRRDFLDEVLKNSFENYSNLLSEYKKVIRNRNKTLKSIYEKKCSKQDIEFWNNKFIALAEEIYKYRFKVINFIKESIPSTLEYFWNKNKKVEFAYLTKVSEDNISEDIKTYLAKNIDRDIILARTPIWPHVDDFDILVDWNSISSFASRWETKSVIIWLKLIEWIFIEKMTGKKPVLLIDDLLSELDEIHKELLLKKIEYYQSFISSITDNNFPNIIKL